jgi:hypothetical protein
MKLDEMIGTCPEGGSEFERKRRFHQGWWRTFVLNVEEGKYEVKGQERSVCNRINSGSTENFLSDNILLALQKTFEERSDSKLGIIEKGRLYNNLLSSQPLAFNFFGEFKINLELATLFFKSLFPKIDTVVNVFFEYPHKENYTNDHSAFDIAIEVRAGGEKGLIGFECKYTDSFSHKSLKSKVNYGDLGSANHNTYRQIFHSSNQHFINDYYKYVRDKELNQLFRNELIGQSLIQNGHFDFVTTGLFCDQDDLNAINSGKKLQQMITGGQNNFRILTYYEFIQTLQKLDIQLEIRNLSMLLWARYCGFSLSDNLFRSRYNK